MKSSCKFFLFLFLGLFLVFGFFPKNIFAYSYELSTERIENFSVEIQIQKDGTYLVKETIVYDFGPYARHGIYRDIPREKIQLKVLKVTDEHDNPYNYEIITRSKSIKIKIGDPDRLISGVHTYKIVYKVFGGILFFKDHDELYWNVTGNQWYVPIKKAKAIVYLPQDVSSQNLQFTCYTGAYRSQQKNCSFSVKNNKEIEFYTTKSLNSYENFTIVLGFPKGIVKEPGFWQKFIWGFQNYWPFLIPLLAFIYFFYQWWKKGRDPRIKRAIVPQYEPPDNLRPAQINAILKQKLTKQDISATIIDLAVRGYIKIKEIENKSLLFTRKDYEIIKTKDFENSEELHNYEKTILKTILGEKESIKISDLKNKRNINSSLSKIYRQCFEELTKLNYFTGNPEKIRNKWAKGMAVFFIISFLIVYVLPLSWYFGERTAFYCFVSVFISGILFSIFAHIMPKKTKKGAETYWKILGFKDFIKTAEKYRAQFYERENIFEEYLPYAIIFGLTGKWAKAFEGIYQQSPDWYEGRSFATFSTSAFVSALNEPLSHFTSAFGQRTGAIGGHSGFGGGGFSGGGFGGGGGGSW